MEAKPLPDPESTSLTEELTEEERTPATLVPVVAIGASAGGLEVFRRLLADLPGDTGFAIVFVQHLDPTHHSMLAEILGRSTAMPVSEAADGMPLEANHVFVIPPNVDLSVADGALQLTPRTQTPGAHMPIDRFLRSVAEQCRNRAVGVILSGTGSDGSAGVEAIKAAGGVTFAQDAATAKFPMMPQSAVATGCIDFVLPPAGIVAELVRISRHPYMAGGQPAPDGPPTAGDEERFRAILNLLRDATSIDFSLYREKMIKRRIRRRLALRNIDSLTAYHKLLQRDSVELMALQRDLLISVTSFFRDRSAFAALKEVAFPRIFQNRQKNETIRVWVAGCATGEEAYSIAISLHEYMNDTATSVPVQIFASDISLAAINKARSGKYLENIEADLSPERLNRYFTKIDGGYQVNKNLREMCVFTRHNLIDDPPFSKLDLISCRNVLIYLGSVRKSIVPIFHYALKPGGLLLLGSSEGPAASELFTAVDGENRIYSRREAVRPLQAFAAAVHGSRRAAPPPSIGLWDSVDSRKEVDRILLSKYSPAGVVVDDALEVIEIRGKASSYLTLPAGKVSFNLLKLIPDTGLFLEVEKLVQLARKTGEPARQDRIPYEHNGAAHVLTVEAVPLDSTTRRSTLILFEPETAAAAEEARSAAPRPEAVTGQLVEKERQIARLKQQLAQAKERFLSSVEAQQTFREESQNTTEEALSANEELQSLNEELETAKEELQSTNEELSTVNDELFARNASLALARDFAMSIVETVRQPLLVLDTELRIKMANRAFYRTFQISPSDAEGQVVFSLAQSSWDLPALRDSLQSLLQDGASFRDVEVRPDFPGLGRRDLVLGGCHINHLRMILLALDDVTEQKDAESALRKTEEHLRQAQKMEAIGRLAGGIAHDFNNLLTAIIGYSDFLQYYLQDNPSALTYLAEIKTAGERAATLTQQLLSFSRRQVLQPKVLDLNAVLVDFDKMLRRLVGERIQIEVTCAPDLWQVMADPGEIGRAVMNLWLNARDAMPHGGALTVETANLTVSPANTAALGLVPGPYVTMAVRDTGVGMDPEMQAHIFEPFFTTKETGKGTGLGLATVLGIVEQSGGLIHCESELGKGTTFRIYLPALAAPAEPLDASTGLPTSPRGTEVVLLAEDEPAIRRLSRAILERQGYVVLEAADGREGLALCNSHKGPIDLLLSDVIMPELGGRELAEAALKVRPGIKVLFMSGHTEDVILKAGIRKGAPFLQKPFRSLALAQKVREVLDTPL